MTHPVDHCVCVCACMCVRSTPFVPISALRVPDFSKPLVNGQQPTKKRHTAWDIRATVGVLSRCYFALSCGVLSATDMLTDDMDAVLSCVRGGLFLLCKLKKMCHCCLSSKCF